MSITKVSIPGIHCDSCVKLVQDVSKEYPTIRNVDVNLAAKTVTIDHDDDFDFAQWSAEVVALGSDYAVTPLPRS